MTSTKHISADAAAALARALTSPFGYSPVTQAIAVSEPHPKLVPELVGLLDGVSVDEWAEDGRHYRTHRGTLPSGLAMEVIYRID